MPRLMAALTSLLTISIIAAGPAFGSDDDPIVNPPETSTCGTYVECLVFGIIVPPGGGGGKGGGLPWSSEHQCYYEVRAAIPDTDLVLVGCVYHQDGSPFTDGDTSVFWEETAVVSPAQLARQALEQMVLRAPSIGMTGGEPPDGMQIVGIPAWLWVADPGESTTPGVGGVEPIVRSVSAGGVTVTATGRLDRTVWSMGDGAVITCSGAKAAGTPWEARYDKAPSPTCGHTYTRTSAGQPDKAYTVTVTAYWVVDWSGGGQSGTLNVQMSRNIPKQVGELQALIIPNPNGNPR